ncbi:hypothetical protein QJS10_CPB20g00031 [Acorus calamus]|uniref:Uncharacterized protein n=1 Tax=Acorus calamus TaxID=4465 RepID=A0AAV9CBA9_ACOCL|nr:hypothetical protein QJS10_CPB20g00031 [Acorus calamus]
MTVRSLGLNLLVSSNWTFSESSPDERVTEIFSIFTNTRESLHKNETTVIEVGVCNERLVATNAEEHMHAPTEKKK